MTTLRPQVIYTPGQQAYAVDDANDLDALVRALEGRQRGDERMLKLMLTRGRARLLPQWSLCYVINHRPHGVHVEIISGVACDRRYWTLPQYLQCTSDKKLMQRRSQYVRADIALNEPSIMTNDEFEEMRSFLTDDTTPPQSGRRRKSA